MSAFQKLILYPLCFLYVITPGSKRLGDNGSHYYDAIVLGVMQAFLIPAIVYYFSSAPQTTYFGLVASVGSWVGAWTFLGGMYYPILSDILDNDKREKANSVRKELDLKAAHVREEQENAMRKSKEDYYIILTENAPADIYQRDPGGVILTEGGRVCYGLIIDAYLLLLEGESGEAEALWMRDAEFVEKEAKRFGIHGYTKAMLKNSRKRIDKKVEALKIIAER